MAGTEHPLNFTSQIDVSLVDWTGNDLSIIKAAKVSTIGDASLGVNDASKGLIKYLMENRHGSPFEHAMMTFFVRAPIFVWREHHRHRVGFSYNEESGRYKELNPDFYIPERARVQTGKPGHYNIVDSDEVAKTSVMFGAIRNATRQAWGGYRAMLSIGIAREVARMCLPVNIMSSCYVTCNPRSLMNFLSLRVDSAEATYASKPQREIQMVAEQYEHHFSRLFPVTWEAFCKAGRVAP